MSSLSELAEYHATSRDSLERACASYLISGEPFPRQRRGYRDDSMDADEEDAEESDIATEQTRITLVNEEALEGVWLMPDIRERPRV